MTRRGLGAAAAMLAAIWVGGAVMTAHPGDRRAGAAPPAGRQAGAPPAFDVLLTPAVDHAGRVVHVAVRLVVGEPAGGPRPLALRIPAVFAGVSGIADRVEGLTARDAAGPLRMEQTQDPADAGGYLHFRHWTSDRPMSGAATVDYRAVLGTARPRSGPPFDLRANGGGVSGAGGGFLVVPDGMGVFRSTIRWDLSRLPAGSAAVSSFGEGDVQVTAPPEPILFSFYLAGPLGRFPQGVKGGGFSAAWLGALPFDAERTLDLAAQAYKALGVFFKDPAPAPFRVFFRVGGDNNAPGGAQLNNSFLMFLPPEIEDEAGLRDTIVHEMVHHWGASLEGKNGESQWWGEGVAVRYASLVPFRAGLLSADDYLDLVNRSVVQFYTNPLRNLPNDQIADRFWSDRNAQVLPYDRGALYLAHVDAKIRAASKGARSVDDVIVAMIEARRRGQTTDARMWLDAVTKELGPSAVQEFERIIVRAESWDPDPDAFGPCFAREPAAFRLFELGFDEAVMHASPRVVRGLVPGSAAERAGLRDGDVIPDTVALNAVRARPEARLAFTVMRDARPTEVSYLPRSDKTVSGYRWVRAVGVSGAVCGERR